MIKEKLKEKLRIFVENVFKNYSAQIKISQ